MRIDESGRTVFIDGRQWPFVAINVKNVTVDIAAGETIATAELVSSASLHIRMMVIAMENGWSVGIDWGSMAECCLVEYQDEPCEEQPDCFEVVILDRERDLITNSQGEASSFPHMVEEALASLLCEMEKMPSNAKLNIDRDPSKDVEGKQGYVLNVGIPVGTPIPPAVVLPGAGEFHDF